MNSRLLRLLGLGVLMSVLSVAGPGCDGCGTESDGDGDADGDGDGDGDIDDGDVDGDTDGDVPPTPRGPTITECPGPLPPAPESGVCSVEPGSSGRILIHGTLLTPGEVFRNGRLLVDEQGMIACVGCDCPADDADTVVACLHGVVSPGLINAHDHITYEKNFPLPPSDERFEHRHDWRCGERGHSEARYNSADDDDRYLYWGELRMVVGGATSLNGAGGIGGFLRNLDRDGLLEGLGMRPVEYSTFPLDDIMCVLRDDACNYGNRRERLCDIEEERSYTPHVGEGIDDESRNEYLCMRDGAIDLVEDQSAIIHGVGLLASDIAEIALSGTDLIWSPRTNVSLYGDTARVTLYDRLGVPIALGTDWIISGSMNMLRELQCADLLNSTYFRFEDETTGDPVPYFTDEQLWLMATLNAARATGSDQFIGQLRERLRADIAIFDGTERVDHRAVIEARPEDVVLVLRAGQGDSERRALPLYGDAELVRGLPGGESCDPLEVCGADKAACVSRETGGDFSYASLLSANGGQYPLFSCAEVPQNEPSCVPRRDASSPDPRIDGSNTYTGEPTDTDRDGDGLADGDDSCPLVFNPIRPLDHGRQPDADGDGLGDECDPCPFHADNPAGCLDDLDGDGLSNDEDACPLIDDPDDPDGDGDGAGDPCDWCPAAVTEGCRGACPVSIPDVKDPAGLLEAGHLVSIAGAIVTAVGASGAYLQVDPDDDGYAGPADTGVYLYTGRESLGLEPGDRIDLVEAEVGAYWCQRQLVVVSGDTEVVAAGSEIELPEATEVTTAEVATGGPSAMELEGTLVRLTDVTVTSVTDDGFVVRDGSGGELLVAAELFTFEPTPSVGEEIGAIFGVLASRFCESALLPRGEQDLVFGAPSLGALTPALTYARAGRAGPTFPEPLTLELTRVAAEPITVSLASSGAGLEVDDVVVPAWTRRVEVPVRAVTASSRPYVVTASLDGEEVTAEVRVLGAAEVPRLTALEPAEATVSVGGELEMTVRLAFPAPLDGVAVAIDVDGAGEAPGSVLVPADRTAWTFLFTAGDVASEVDVTAELGDDAFTSRLTLVEGPMVGLVINEIDYDNPGEDTVEYLELYNASAAPVELDGLIVVCINGATNEEYQRVALSGTLGPHEFLVLGTRAVQALLPEGVVFVERPSNWLQNGDPDGVAVFDTVAGVLVDALCYEGAIDAAAIDGAEGTFALYEGSPTSVTDRGDGALIRIPDGGETGDDGDNWFRTMEPTPGRSNVLVEP